MTDSKPLRTSTSLQVVTMTSLPDGTRISCHADVRLERGKPKVLKYYDFEIEDDDGVVKELSHAEGFALLDYDDHEALCANAIDRYLASTEPDDEGQGGDEP